ncbi:MAG: hypothetical protein HY313_02890 [Acidobacteria bacterium]|nr:hypothetical protein [Acidobacteriota bacterium]
MAIVLAVLLASRWAFGVETKFWTSATFDDFAEGNFSGVSLSREGAIRLAPELEEIFNTDQAMIWAVAQDGRGNLYLGTGHSGKVFRLGRDLKGSLFFDAQEPDIFALAVDKDGNVFVGTSPEGKVYKVDSAGNAKEFFDPQARYIWALTFASDGQLYVGTGDRGKIFRVNPNGEGELFYDTQQRHVVSLALTEKDELLAGTEPNGLLYRVSQTGKGFVLYQAALTEIHGVVVASDGSIYASAMGAAGDRRMRVPGAQPVTQPVPLRTTTTITVQAAQGPSPLPGQGGGEGQPDQPALEPTPQPQPAEGTPAAFQPVQIPRLPGSQATKSALYRIWPDNSVETLWDSTQESAFDLLPREGSLLFSTDEKGRIYELTPDRQLSLLAQTDQEETTRLIPFGDRVLATTANLGKVFRLGKQPGASGSYESNIRDAGNIASWGTLRWSGEVPAGASVEFYARSGNSRRPDATWSDWVGPYRKPSGEGIQTPPARYLQWKAVLRPAADQSPIVRDVTVAYLPRNQAPDLKDLKVTARGENASSTSSLGSISGIGTPGSNRARGASPAGSLLNSAAPQRGMDIRWTANDPDGDELQYSLYFRGEGEQEWKLLAEELQQPYFQLAPDALPDGKYRIKIMASDAKANPATTAKSAERISSPFVLDNTPPQLEVLETTRKGSTATARFRAKDNTGVITRAEYTVDAGSPVPLLSEDGILDSSEETFVISLDSLNEREHLLTLRVYDSAGIVGMGKTVWPASNAQGGN